MIRSVRIFFIREILGEMRYPFKILSLKLQKTYKTEGNGFGSVSFLTDGLDCCTLPIVMVPAHKLKISILPHNLSRALSSVDDSNLSH